MLYEIFGLVDLFENRFDGFDFLKKKKLKTDLKTLSSDTFVVYKMLLYMSNCIESKMNNPDFFLLSIVQTVT